MLDILADTKVYKNYQTVIPKEIRERFGVDNGTIIEWGIDENGDTKFQEKSYLKRCCRDYKKRKRHSGGLAY